MRGDWGQVKRIFCMGKKLSKVAIQITRFLDPHNPGVVEGKLMDAEGVVHTFVDKVSIFTTEMLDADSTYPQAGHLECRVLAQLRDTAGRSLVRIRTIESTEENSEFVVLSSQISD
jgi:hypothetical protein